MTQQQKGVLQISRLRYSNPTGPTANGIETGDNKMRGSDLFMELGLHI